jgi:hypothetical protein
MDILNHPRILRCIDDLEIDVPPSLRKLISTQIENCQGYNFFFFFLVYIYLLIRRCERICCLANLKVCSAGHFACSVCLKEAAINAKKSGYILFYLLFFFFFSLSYIPCLLTQSCTNIIGFAIFLPFF